MQIRITFGVVLVVVVSSACADDEELRDCGQARMTVTASALEGCPTRAEAARLFPSEKIISDPVSVELAREAMTVCWYRDPQLGRVTSCPPSRSRAVIREDEGDPRPALSDPSDVLRPAPGTRVLEGCADDHTALLGYVIGGAKSVESAANREVAECPDAMFEERDGSAESSFVGRDFYPALLRCEYASERRQLCGGGSGGGCGGADTIGMLGG